MIVQLRENCTDTDVDAMRARLTALGCPDSHSLHRQGRHVIACSANGKTNDLARVLRALPEVDTVWPIAKRHKLASREFQPHDTVVRVGNALIGGGHFQIIAGPCALESREQIRHAADDMAKAGLGIMRAGVYKPRTSPYDFQGLREAGLPILADVRAEYGLAVVTEVTAPGNVPAVAAVADMLQVGARNAQNYDLLECVAHAGKPVLLKRGMAAKISEWLAAAEYLLVNGCPDVILCERGIRTFEDATRNTLDISAIALAKQETHLPVIVDPSHAAGRPELVEPLATAAIAAGADGLLIEAHPAPETALCDPGQQLPSAHIAAFRQRLEPLVQLMGKHMEQSVESDVSHRSEAKAVL